MMLAMRTALVILIGAVVAFLCYIAADLSLGSGASPAGMNPNFSAVISAWRTLGGSAGHIEGGPDRAREFGDGRGPAGEPPSADARERFEGGFEGRGRGHRGSGLGEGISLDRAIPQIESDLVWIGIPALIGAAIELVFWYVRRLRRRSSGSAAEAAA